MPSTSRSATISRTTNETDISLTINLDGSGQVQVDTGAGFADHMLHLLAFWAGMDLTLKCTGDLHIDAHHTLEDVGLCLGAGLAEALGDKAGIRRVGHAVVPMDEACAETVLDLSGRAHCVVIEGDGRTPLLPPTIAGEEKDVWREMLKSIAAGARMNLHIHMRYGQNGHHLLEAAFKSFGLALREAIAVHGDRTPSTKGALD